MKKIFILGLCGLLLLNSCSNAADGAIIGGQFGNVLGSAIGGITGGGRGHDWGALIGTVGGVAAGAAVGAAVEKKHEEAYNERMQSRMQREMEDDDSYGRGSVNERYYVAYEPPLEIRYPAITESQRDGVLTRGEECTLRMEIYNTSDQPVYDVRPLVEDITHNKHVHISENLRVESIAPHAGVRYTATIKGDRRLKNGEIKVRVGVAQGNREARSQRRCFSVPTSKSY